MLEREKKHSIAVTAAEIVPGDMVLLEAGNIVPADMRICRSASLTIDESGLTGESVPVDKTAKKLFREKCPLLTEATWPTKGTVVLHGRGRAVVTSTGMQTELGKIAGMLQQQSPMTPLQRRMSDFSKSFQ